MQRNQTSSRGGEMYPTTTVQVQSFEGEVPKLTLTVPFIKEKPVFEKHSGFQ